MNIESFNTCSLRLGPFDWLTASDIEIFLKIYLFIYCLMFGGSIGGVVLFLWLVLQAEVDCSGCKQWR